MTSQARLFADGTFSSALVLHKMSLKAENDALMFPGSGQVMEQSSHNGMWAEVMSNTSRSVHHTPTLCLPASSPACARVCRAGTASVGSLPRPRAHGAPTRLVSDPAPHPVFSSPSIKPGSPSPPKEFMFFFQSRSPTHHQKPEKVLEPSDFF